MKIKATRMVITATIKLKKINLLTKPKPCAVSKYVSPLDPLKAATLYPMVLPQAVTMSNHDIICFVECSKFK